MGGGKAFLLQSAGGLGVMGYDNIFINRFTRDPSCREGIQFYLLESGRLWGAGLDVTDPEPLPPEHPLWRQPRALITPHTAGKKLNGTSSFTWVELAKTAAWFGVPASVLVERAERSAEELAS